MHAWQRLLTGLPFSIVGTGPAKVGPCVESVIRLALELRRLGRGEVAFAVVGEWPENAEADCALVNQCTDNIEAEVATWLAAASPEDRPFEVGAWCGTPSEEWALAAQASEMDLLIVPGTVSGGAIPADAVTWPTRAECPIWFVGQEADALSGEPPLVLCVDDFSDEAEEALRVAIKLAQAWSARLLVGHVVPKSEPLPKDRDDELRRTAFARLSRNDFRCIAHGTNFLLQHGEFEDLINAARKTQSPHLILWPITGNEMADVAVFGTAHLLLWPLPGTER